MAEWTLTCWNGKKYVLPNLLAWKLEYGLGSPCDSFWVKFLWKGGQIAYLTAGTRMTVTHGGETVFFGVVDECECVWSEEGCVAEISGRGMQALLLDNQAEAVDFRAATLSEILRRYVTPYGISLAKPVNLPWVSWFSVASGSSCWKVVYDFARYYAGVTPRFTRTGKLDLSPFGKETPVALGKGAAVKRIAFREKRYGVLSQVTVKDAARWNRQVEGNTAFRNQGGCASRVLLMPRKTGYQARRYNARFQLQRSEAERELVEVTVASWFGAWPGDLLRLDWPRWEKNGLYRVRACEVSFGENGLETVLLLGNPDAVL